MALKDFAEGHGLGFGEGDKSEVVGEDSGVGERGGDSVCIVDADGDFFAVPSEADVEFFLEAHEGFNEGVGHGDMGDEGGGDVGADGFYGRVDGEADAGGVEVVGLEPGVEAEVGAAGSGNAFDGGEVGAVGEEFDVDLVAGDGAKVAADHREFFDEGGEGDFMA